VVHLTARAHAIPVAASESERTYFIQCLIRQPFVAIIQLTVAITVERLALSL
jgi:hypothetical protein